MGAYTPPVALGGPEDPEYQSTYTGTLVADVWAATGLTLPLTGWAWMCGDIAERHFSIRLPVSYITERDAVADGDDTLATGIVRFFIGNSVSHDVCFGHGAGGELMVASGTAGAVTLGLHV